MTIFTAKVGSPIGSPIGSPMDKDDGNATYLLTDRQSVILKLIIDNRKISKRKLAEYLGINVSAVQAHLDALKQKGVLDRKGGTRGYWVIKNNPD